MNLQCSDAKCERISGSEDDNSIEVNCPQDGKSNIFKCKYTGYNAFISSVCFRETQDQVFPESQVD